MKSLTTFVFLVLLVFCCAQRYVPELPGRTNRIEPPRSRQARSVFSSSRDPISPPRTVKGIGKFSRRIPKNN
ncbi:hypothetical protein CAEBREN_24122 [Caenorhabditis brenneri]|uniref:Uncharacterized protein n=1 Tax=Caenorhabditis brenneri TaxID=135651 RepID=G0NRD1_CAEBE|nr:hypothetical protein CAEBREN_24122 [Caenorhabditis brenneri]